MNSLHPEAFLKPNKEIYMSFWKMISNMLIKLEAHVDTTEANKEAEALKYMKVREEQREKLDKVVEQLKK